MDVHRLKSMFRISIIHNNYLWKFIIQIMDDNNSNYEQTKQYLK